MRRVPTSDAALQITVTTTPTSLKKLLDTANGSALNLDETLDAVEFNAEDGDIRYSGSADPSSTKGLILAQGQTRIKRHVPISQLILVAGSNTLVNVDVGSSIS